MGYETIEYTVSDDHVATVKLNRPDVLHAFNQTMCEEFRDVWQRVSQDDAVHAVVLRSSGERAFSAGLDRKRGYDVVENPFVEDTPVTWLCPKLNRVWKPIVCAVQGMAVGGALYWINESDIVICSPEARFCDPHVSLGLASARASIGFSRRIAFGEALRMALLGSDEWLSAERALAIGYVSEIVDQAELWDRAHALAAQIAAKPPAAVQSTLRAMWDSLDMPLSTAWRNAPAYSQIANPIAANQRASGPQQPDVKPTIR